MGTKCRGARAGHSTQWRVAGAICHLSEERPFYTFPRRRLCSARHSEGMLGINQETAPGEGQRGQRSVTGSAKSPLWRHLAQRSLKEAVGGLSAQRTHEVGLLAFPTGRLLPKRVTSLPRAVESPSDLQPSAVARSPSRLAGGDGEGAEAGAGGHENRLRAGQARGCGRRLPLLRPWRSDPRVCPPCRPGGPCLWTAVAWAPQSGSLAGSEHRPLLWVFQA